MRLWKDDVTLMDPSPFHCTLRTVRTFSTSLIYKATHHALSRTLNGCPYTTYIADGKAVIKSVFWMFMLCYVVTLNFPFYHSSQ